MLYSRCHNSQRFSNTEKSNIQDCSEFFKFSTKSLCPGISPCFVHFGTTDHLEVSWFIFFANESLNSAKWEIVSACDTIEKLRYLVVLMRTRTVSKLVVRLGRDKEVRGKKGSESSRGKAKFICDSAGAGWNPDELHYFKCRIWN